MKEIPLTQGKVALVDDEDYLRVGWPYRPTARLKMIDYTKLSVEELVRVGHPASCPAIGELARRAGERDAARRMAEVASGAFSRAADAFGSRKCELKYVELVCLTGTNCDLCHLAAAYALAEAALDMMGAMLVDTPDSSREDCAEDGSGEKEASSDAR